MSDEVAFSVVGEKVEQLTEVSLEDIGFRERSVGLALRVVFPPGCPRHDEIWRRVLGHQILSFFYNTSILSRRRGLARGCRA